jgi:hypothetical protein
MTKTVTIRPEAIAQEDPDPDAIVSEILEAKAAAEESEADAGSEYRWQMADGMARLSEQGWNQTAIGKRCRMSQPSVSVYLACSQLYQVPDNRPKFANAYAEVNPSRPHTYALDDTDEEGAGAHVANNSGDSEWFTPEPYIVAARKVMGGIDLDPASTEVANTIVGATKFYTKERDGLRHRWEGRVWMNPPYAQPGVWEFSEKLAEEVAIGNVTQACALVNNATETAFFQRLCEVAAAICFPAGRVKFWHPDKESAPLQGQAVIYCGPEVEAFRREFLAFGFTVTL